MTPIQQQDPVGPNVISRSAVLTVGYSDADLRRARRSGELTVLSPGIYLRGAGPPDLDRAQWQLAAAAAAISRLSGNPVVSHLSAAVLHGLRAADGEPQPVHITRAAPAKSRRGPRLIAHRATLAADDVVTLSGLAVTAMPRTVLDCAFLLPFDQAVPQVVAALDRGCVSAQVLTAQLAGYRRVPGIRRVTWVIESAIDLHPTAF